MIWLMKKLILVLSLSISCLLLTQCAGMKVVNPNEPNNQGTKQLDFSGGSIKVVDTYTCKLFSGGNRFSAVGKTEEEASKEVVARCHDRTLLSFCKAENVKCEKN